MKNNKRGRPIGTIGEYKEIKKSSFIQIRVTEEEKAKLQELANSNEKSISRFLLDLAFDKSENWRDKNFI